MTRLDEIKARMGRATPGEWTVAVRTHDKDHQASIGTVGPRRVALAMCPRYSLKTTWPGDSDFIAHARAVSVVSRWRVRSRHRSLPARRAVASIRRVYTLRCAWAPLRHR